MASEHARAAKAIREELKKAYPDIKFSVRSSSASMCSAVDIETRHKFSYEQQREIYKLLKRFEMGSFDGMTDCYDYDNVNNDIPQVKYISVQVIS